LLFAAALSPLCTVILSEGREATAVEGPAVAFALHLLLFVILSEAKDLRLL
jgi:hypothetical protein